MENDVLIAVLKRLDVNTRSNLERTCKHLLHLSRSCKPRLLQLTIHFTATWNLEHIVEITAQFSTEHTFHAALFHENQWMTGRWASEHKNRCSSGVFAPERLRLSHTFVERSSRYVEYWLRNFQYEALRVRVENLVPGRESDIQQMNYTGTIPPLKVKKFILEGANNIRFILNWLNALVLNKSDKKKSIEVEMIDVAKLDQIFHSNVITKGDVSLRFHRNSAHFGRKTLNYISGPIVELTARKIPSETINVFLKRWTHRDMTDNFRLLNIVETTDWSLQKMRITEILNGIRHQVVTIDTHLDLKVLQLPEKPKIYRILGHRMAFCALSSNQFVFEVPSDSSEIEVRCSKEYDEYDRQKSRLYLELFRLRRFFH